MSVERSLGNASGGNADGGSASREEAASAGTNRNGNRSAGSSEGVRQEGGVKRLTSGLVLPGSIAAMVESRQAPAAPVRSVRRPAGYVEIVSPDASVSQGGETLMCVHCQMHWIVKPGSGKSRGFCMRCDGPTCGKLMCEIRCVPFEKMIEEREARARLRAVAP